MSGFKQPYHDPGLTKNRARYLRLLRVLQARGLLGFKRNVKETVGLFAVWKKNGEQRLILDGRGPNLRWADSPPARLATGQSFAAIVAEGEQPLEIGGVDIAVAFYAMGLPAELQEYFGLPAVRCGELDVTAINGVACSAGELVHPVFTAIPMGWSQALYICQEVLESIAGRVPEVREDNCLRDRKPAPSPSPFLHTEYADNFVMVGTQRGSALRLSQAVKTELEAAGLPTHEAEGAVGGTTLGWDFSALRPEVGASRRGVWRMRLAIDAILQRGRIRGSSLSRLVGHYSFRALMRREMLSVLHAVYGFAHANWDNDAALWPAVARELRWCRGLAHLSWRNLGATWCSEVSVFDASSYGMGVVTKKVPEPMVRETCKFSDRWRFRRRGEAKAGRPREFLETGADGSPFSAPEDSEVPGDFHPRSAG